MCTRTRTRTQIHPYQLILSFSFISAKCHKSFFLLQIFSKCSVEQVEHVHTDTHTMAHAHTCTLSHGHTRTHSHGLTHRCTHTHSHTHTLTWSHTHTHSHGHAHTELPTFPHSQHVAIATATNSCPRQLSPPPPTNGDRCYLDDQTVQKSRTFMAMLTMTTTAAIH